MLEYTALDHIPRVHMHMPLKYGFTCMPVRARACVLVAARVLSLVLCW